MTFEAVHLFHCFLKKCSNAFIQSLYRNGKVITESRHAKKVMFLTKHLSTRKSWQQSYCSDKNCEKNLHIDNCFLKNNTDLQENKMPLCTAHALSPNNFSNVLI